VADYQSKETDKLESEARKDVEQLEKAYQEANQPKNDWVDEFKTQELNGRLEEEIWFSQFLEGGSKAIPSSMTTSWVNDFQRDAWVSEFANERETPSWIDEFEREKSKNEFQNLTQKFSAIEDPKLRNSNFMKFIDKINQGKVKFVENTVIEELED